MDSPGWGLPVEPERKIEEGRKAKDARAGSLTGLGWVGAETKVDAPDGRTQGHGLKVTGHGLPGLSLCRG